MPGVRGLGVDIRTQRREPLAAEERGWSLAELARRQHGVVSAWQLHELGFDKSAIRRLIAQGRLHPIHRGVYAVGHSALTVCGRWMAAVLAVGPGALLSHRSAGALAGIIGARGPIHVTVPGTAGRRRLKGVVVHTSTCLSDEDRTVRTGVPVTAVPRTLLDLAASLPTQLERTFEEADRCGLLEQAAVLDLLDRAAGHPGVGRLARLADVWLAPSDDARNEFERRFARFCVEHGLPIPAMNVLVCGYEVDALWPDAKLIVELDSWGFHGHRQAFERDRERDATLQVAGYRVIRITWRRLEREPAAVAATLRSLLAEGDVALATPTC